MISIAFSAAARADPSTRPETVANKLRRLRYRRRFRRPNLTGMPAAPTHSVPQNTATRTRISCRERSPSAATAATPLKLLLSTGLKAVDHAVERLCSKSANLFSDTLSEKALHLLSASLPTIAKDRSDQDALAAAQIGMWFSPPDRQPASRPGPATASVISWARIAGCHMD